MQSAVYHEFKRSLGDLSKHLSEPDAISSAKRAKQKT